MKTQLLFVVVISALLVFTGCKKNNTNSGANIRLTTSDRSDVVGRISNTADVSGRTTGTITWTSGFAHATEIEFEAEKENEDEEIEFKTKSLQKIDLFAAPASLGFVTIPPGVYEEVEFEVRLASNGAEPALELRGNYNGTPIVFRLNGDFEIEAEFEDVTIDAGTDFTATINLRLNMLTDDITDAALIAATLTNGAIIISANSNTALFAIIMANFRNIDDVEFDD